jgi:hypothetical protein
MGGRGEKAACEWDVDAAQAQARSKVAAYRRWREANPDARSRLPRGRRDWKADADGRIFASSDYYGDVAEDACLTAQTVVAQEAEAQVAAYRSWLDQHPHASLAERRARYPDLWEIAEWSSLRNSGEESDGCTESEVEDYLLDALFQSREFWDLFRELRMILSMGLANGIRQTRTAQHREMVEALHALLAALDLDAAEIDRLLTLVESTGIRDGVLNPPSPEPVTTPLCPHGPPADLSCQEAVAA